MSLVEHDDMVQTLSPYTSREPFGIRILPWAEPCGSTKPRPHRKYRRFSGHGHIRIDLDLAMADSRRHDYNEIQTEGSLWGRSVYDPKTDEAKIAGHDAALCDSQCGEFEGLVEWAPPDNRILSAWGNKDNATRDGAYACAIATSEHLLGLYAVRRAETLTGADYYVTSENNQIDDLEKCFRLEVSGTDLDKPEMRRRLVIKIKQVLEGKSNLPALAIVVGFRIKQILLQFAEETP